ncbi:MAG TPA: ATP-binding protein [Chloroflexaceae bacterium]|nr:ATP-binding protein [Chloroflexaceae bacterium]
MQIPSPTPRFWRPAAGLARVPAVGAALSLAAVALLTALMLTLQAVIHSATAALLYILVVLLSAMAFGLSASLAAALLAAIVFTYFFIPPYGGFGINSVEDAVRLGAFLSVALLVSGLASRARRQADAAARRAAELSALYQLSQALEAEVDLPRILPIVARTTARLLDVPGCAVLLADAEGRLVQRAAEGVTAAGIPQEQVPLRVDQRTLGALRVAQRAPDDPLSEEEHELLRTVAAQVSLVLERVRLSELAGQARVLAESDRVKSALLSLVSHDLRTPLAVVKGLVTSLLDPSVGWTDAQRRELLATIDEETDRLNRIVGELLEMSRIEAGAVSQARSWHDLDELIAAVGADLGPRLPQPLQCDVPGDLPWVRISYAQIEQVLRNLLENAAHYAPPARPIEIVARQEDGHVRVEVRDRGPGVPESLRERIFEKFVRAAPAERHAAGAGLGLAICKGLVEAHGGRIWAEPRPGGGSTFAFTLPIEPRPAPQPAGGEEQTNHGPHPSR